MLGENGAEVLPAPYHRAVLCHLCNESLDREPLRVMLAARMENAEGVKKEMREAVAEDKGKLKVRSKESLKPVVGPGVGVLHCIIGSCSVSPAQSAL
jgi:hypothetical protein